MAFGLGVLALTPRDFWAMSFPEFWAAVDGYSRANGGGGEALAREDVERLQDLMRRAEEADRGK